MAFRHCNSNGTWAYVLSLNRTWSNYSECLHFLQTEISLQKVWALNPDKEKRNKMGYGRNIEHLNISNDT